MLNGLDPIIIFNFEKKIPIAAELVSKIPFVSSESTSIPFPPIPIYLSEELTGILIDSEDKNIDVETSTETKSDGTTPDTTQKGIGSGVTINMTAKKDSLGMALLSALMDQLYEKVTSQEYSITYLHGAVTVFGGQLHSYSATQNSEDELLHVKIAISKGSKQPTKAPEGPFVEGARGTQPL